MSIILTCALTAGFAFFAPEGYAIERIAGPAKAVGIATTDSDSCPNCITNGTLYYRGGGEKEKITIWLKQIAKAGDTITLPSECTGQDTGIKFQVK